MDTNDSLPGIGEWANDVVDYPLSQDPLQLLIEQELTLTEKEYTNAAHHS